MATSDSTPDPGELRKIESGSTFEVWQFRSSTMRLDWSRAGVVAVTVTGHGHAEFAAPCIRRWNEALRTSNRHTSLSDFWDMPSYDSAFRLALTDWSLEHRAQIDTIHILTRSAIVSMGVTVANLALGGLIKIHSLRTSYDLALKQLCVPSKLPRRR